METIGLMQSSGLDVHWLLPSEPSQSGGPLLAARLARFLNSIPHVRSSLALVEQKSASYPHIDAVLQSASIDGARRLFVVTFGPAVPRHIGLIRSRCDAPILYYAQSIGWKQHRQSMSNQQLSVPVGTDIACVSRYVMAQWNANARNSRVAYVPPLVSPVFVLAGHDRDVDVLVHRRKQSMYCLNELLPALHKANLRVHVIDGWLEQETLARLLNRTKVFLYHTQLLVQGSPHFPLGEGFGLPPLEALLCGAHVASDMLGGVNDFLDQRNCTKLLTLSAEEDCDLIAKAVQRYTVDEPAARDLRVQYSEANVRDRWRELLCDWYG